MPHSAQKITLLYVEDDAATRELVTRALQNKPEYILITAVDGREGLELFRVNQVDIVLTDIMMPRMNGLEMSRAIRKESPDCQIVVMTAFSDTDYLIDAIDIGVNRFVLKPIEFKKLGVALDHCCEVVQMRRQLKKQEAEIQRAKKMEAIGILAGGMAHDFNNLLQIILGYLSLALCNAEPESKTHEMLTIAERSSIEAQRLSKRLLSLARGGLFTLISCDIRPLLGEALNLMRQHHGITVEYSEPDDLPNVRIDGEQIYQLFCHILNNASEAMPNGGIISVTLSEEAVSEDAVITIPAGNYIHISIQDTGCGISPELLPDIFDPYVTTKEMGSTKGTGLGLTLCHAIVRKHNGAVFVESTVGKGTTVHVYLPAAEPEDS